MQTLGIWENQPTTDYVLFEVEKCLAGFDFAEKKVLVTGASQGIGYGIAEAFAAAGANLHVLAVDDGIAAAAERLNAITHQCDITDEAAVHDCLASIGPLDVLVNNAGLERITPLEAENEAEVSATFRRIMDINVNGTFYVTRAALKAMPRGAAIVNTASIWGKTAPAYFSAYAASKHAIIGLTRSWARELGEKSIRVNAVCPGWVKTEASLLSLRRICETEGRAEDDVLSEIIGAQDLPGLMSPQDVAGLYLFLASSLAASITGQAVNADRGEVQG